MGNYDQVSDNMRRVGSVNFSTDSDTQALLKEIRALRRDLSEITGTLTRELVRQKRRIAELEANNE